MLELCGVFFGGEGQCGYTIMKKDAKDWLKMHPNNFLSAKTNHRNPPPLPLPDRYRLRKRAELDSLEEELHGLEGQNRELRDKAESVEREIQYVKDLLIEVYKARSQRLKQDGSA